MRARGIIVQGSVWTKEEVPFLQMDNWMTFFTKHLKKNCLVWSSRSRDEKIQLSKKEVVIYF